MKRLLALIVGALLGLLIWGIAVEPHLIDEERWTVHLDGLPSSWQGESVAVIGDLQVGMWFDNTGTIDRVVQRLVEKQPALILIVGDFVYHPLAEAGGPSRRQQFGAEAHRVAESVIEQAVSLVQPQAESGLPVFAVLGNHDYGMQSQHAAALDWLAGDLEQRLEAAGVTVLKNEAVALPAPAGNGNPGSLLYLAGIGAHYPDYDDPARALEGVPPGAARLVMMHNPASFRQLPPGAAPLAFAGHTHGGQIGVPGTPQWSWMALVGEDEVHADGWVEGFGASGNRLYVNRGIGFSVIPMRISAMPEITWIELRSPEGDRGSIPEP